MYSPKQITLDLQEFEDMKEQLTTLTSAEDGSSMTELDRQDAQGRLLYVALNNPGLFKFNGPEAKIDLGKYTAHIKLGITGGTTVIITKHKKNGA